MTHTFASALSTVRDKLQLPRGDLERLSQAASGSGPIVVNEIRNGPFWDPSIFSFESLFADFFHNIAEEFHSFSSQRKVPVQQRKSLRTEIGSWNALNLSVNGKVVEETAQYFPVTTNCLREAGVFDGPGLSYFSVLAPETVVKPHYGPHNFRLRCHLPIKIPQECNITVDGVSKTWTTGDLMIIDDSFEHCVENRSNEERVVLVFDVWNPSLTSREREAIREVMRLVEYGRNRLEYAKQSTSGMT